MLRARSADHLQPGSEGSESASESEQNDPPSSLASDAEQYERMQAFYTAVGRDFKDQEDFIGSERRKLQMGGQLGNHPPCVATGAVPQRPSGKPHLQSIRAANTANPVSKSTQQFLIDGLHPVEVGA